MTGPKSTCETKTSRGGPSQRRFQPPGGGGPSQLPPGGGPYQLGGGAPGGGAALPPKPRSRGGGGGRVCMCWRPTDASMGPPISAVPRTKSPCGTKGG